MQLMESSGRSQHGRYLCDSMSSASAIAVAEAALSLCSASISFLQSPRLEVRFKLANSGIEDSLAEW